MTWPGVDLSPLTDTYDGELPVLVADAVAFGVAAMAGIERKHVGGPYINHPIRVAGLARRWVDADEVLTAALVLHDVVEDTAVTIEEIRARFGFEVAVIVGELTDDVSIVGNRAFRKHAIAVGLGQASKASQTGKCCDVLDNTGSIVEHDPKFAAVYLTEVEFLLSQLTAADPVVRRMAVRQIQSGFEQLGLRTRIQ